jgi:aminoglycoside phosphotransferase (APT) family kinase protein
MKHNVVKKLGVGSAGDAFLLEGGKAIIVGKREDSFGTYQAMFKKMQVLDDKITAVKYPKFYELISPCDDYPFGAVIEEYISGAELRDEVANLSESQKREIGRVLARFITEVHNIDSEDNKEEEIEINLAKFDRSLGILKDYLPEETINDLASIKSNYASLMQNKEFCATHGDLNAGNIMIGEDGKVSGIIDLGNMEYYIPEIEFVHMYFFD